MSWLILVILTYFLFSINNILQKIIITNTRNSFILLLLEGIAFLPLLLVPFFYNINTTEYFFIVLMIFVPVLSYGAFFIYLRALKKDEVSRVVSLWNIAPIITLVLAFLFLHEELPPNFYIAFFLMLAGSIIISLKDFRGKFSHYSLLMMFLSSLLYSTVIITIKYTLNFLTLYDVLFYNTIGGTIVCSFLIFSKKAEISREFYKIKKKKVIVFYMFIALIAGISYVFSIREAPASILTVLGGFQGIFVFGLTVLLSVFAPEKIKENVGLQNIAIKVLSLALMLISLYFLVL